MIAIVVQQYGTVVKAEAFNQIMGFEPSSVSYTVTSSKLLNFEKTIFFSVF